MKPFFKTIIAGIMALELVAVALASAQDGKNGQSDARGMVLAEAAMCEQVSENTRCNKAVAFSITLGQVSCLTVFDQIEDKSFVYHSWYRQDTLSTKKRLAIKPPRWATVSTMELREADKGPWRVEISDSSGRVLAVLRFSVVD
jgi:hypothetical protein